MRKYSGRKAAVWVGLVLLMAAAAPGQVTTERFAREIERSLAMEERYDYHKRLSEGPIHLPRRDPEARVQPGEMAVAELGWRLLWDRRCSPPLQNAVRDFQDYLEKSMRVRVQLQAVDSLAGADLARSIVVGTRDQLPESAAGLRGPKDYAIAASPDRIVICGYDERGAAHGLYNLEERMNLREAPFLPRQLKTVRNSLYQTRMVLSWMGWMDWPDKILNCLAHDGFDGIFASVYANPNGDASLAENSTEFYARLLFRNRKQDPARMRDLIERAARFGIRVYAPIIYQYLGTAESEAGLRRLVRAVLADFPEIRGYILLTEGFYYGNWRAGHARNDEEMKDWARKWTRAVAIVAEECHRADPTIEILPWEYNIDFRPQKADLKRYFISQLPADTIPLLTWENGKGFEIDGLRGYLRDYSVNQVGPAEVTLAQIDEAGRRGMKVYSKVDTFASWQFGTVPYLPFPHQWHSRYQALEKHGVKGTLESWSNGYKPNFIAELRAWFCWSDAPPLDQLLGAIARRDFGAGAEKLVLDAWDHFSRAIRLVPDTGPYMGTNNAVGNPLFFQPPPARTATFHHSWTDHDKWMGYFGGELNPHWPFTVSRMVFYPDFTNKKNEAESYARYVSGIGAVDERDVQGRTILPVFLKYLRLAADQLEEGLKLYRQAALLAPAGKRRNALREVVVAEQIRRMLLSNHAILEFESLRLELAGEQNPAKEAALLGRMQELLRAEIARTRLSLLAADRDSRLGFHFEQDYVYTPYSLREKLKLMQETLDEQLPAYRARRGLPPARGPSIK